MITDWTGSWLGFSTALGFNDNREQGALSGMARRASGGMTLLPAVQRDPPFCGSR